MKVLIINGSPRVNGNTAIAVNEMAGTFHAEGVETEIVQVGNKDVRGLYRVRPVRQDGKMRV